MKSDSKILQFYEATKRDLQIETSIKGKEPDASRYWTQELESLDYLLCANSRLLNRLREHFFWITGDFVYRYKEHHHESSWFNQLNFRFHEICKKFPKHKFIYEPKELSGFGYPIGNGMVNIDTIKFNESLIALGLAFPDLYNVKDGYILEIGGGWGGFAHALKQTNPRIKVILVDFPEILLLAATYLYATNPEKKIQVLNSSEIDVTADFVLCTNSNSHLIPENIDVHVVANICSFQEMTSEQIVQYINLARKVSAKGIYSHNREKSPYNVEMNSISSIMKSEGLLENNIEIFPSSYTKPMWEYSKQNNKKRTFPARHFGLQKTKKEKAKNKLDLSYVHKLFTFQ
jgi:hypothetical protein